MAGELSRIPHLQLLANEPLSRHTRFALGGPARWLADATTPLALQQALAALRHHADPWLLIGGGTNLIVADGGFDGVVLRYRGAELQQDQNEITAGSGADLEALVDSSVAAGLGGLECLKRIPGWVGAAIYGNAGAYGQQVSDRLTRVTFHDGEQIREWSRQECQFRYRASRFKEHRGWVILSASFALTPGDRSALAAQAEEIRAIRDEKFPPTLRCAGSIFKNLIHAALPAATQSRVPSRMIKGGKVPAAWFLEQVGAKGFSRGGIRVADYHANLIYNAGDGRAGELIQLLDELKRRVQAEFNFTLEEEVQYVGFANRVSY
ncbi:MAG: UDP-N-acetylmuramate dehydrogenase [Bryobacteraceae bacterium]|nr:UDP-N-acetylmuramate dehydrogenase [Bryobacteraceae bacterium]